MRSFKWGMTRADLRFCVMVIIGCVIILGAFAKWGVPALEQTMNQKTFKSVFGLPPDEIKIDSVQDRIQGLREEAKTIDERFQSCLGYSYYDSDLVCEGESSKRAHERLHQAMWAAAYFGFLDEENTTIENP